MEEEKKTNLELLDEQIHKALEELDDMRVFTDESVKPVLEKLKVLHQQQIELQKLEAETALKIKELELKEKNDKESRKLEEKKLEIEEEKAKEQKRSNVTQAVIGGVTAATGIGGILASVHCFKKGLRFEETGSYTTKTAQNVGGLFNLFRRK